MLAGLALFYVGAVLCLNGLWVLGRIGDKEIAVIDIFVGGITLLVALNLAFGPGADLASVKRCAFLLLFTFTYFWVALNRYNGADGRGLGWFCLFVAITCPQQIDDALASGITTLIGGGTGPAHGIERMLQAADGYPINLGFLGKGNAIRSMPSPSPPSSRWRC